MTIMIILRRQVQLIAVANKRHRYLLVANACCGGRLFSSAHCFQSRLNGSILSLMHQFTPRYKKFVINTAKNLSPFDSQNILENNNLRNIHSQKSSFCDSCGCHNKDRKYLSTSSKIMAKIISGKEVSDEIRKNLKKRVELLAVKPKLAIVQVGGREDSNVYIRMKLRFAESIGAEAELIKLPRDATEAEVASKVIQLNDDTSVHGIITQLPFDAANEIDSDKIVNMIDPKKDVDGLTVYNAGKLLHGELRGSAFKPCTPNGCIELIKRSGIEIAGTYSVVIGRSKIVGSPMAQLLVWHNSTVTICHSKTKNLQEICSKADILVAAVGRAQMVKASWIKPGAVVIDCGINAIPDATKKSGSRLVGDVDFENCQQVASAITPVPGGVGPMTVAMLIANTVEAAEKCVGKLQ